MENSKIANEILFEHGIDTKSLNDDFNTNLFHAIERYAEQFKAQEQGYSLEDTFKQIDEEAERLYPYQKATVFNSGEIGRRQKNKVDADRMKFKSAAIFGYKLLPKPTAHEQKQVPTDEAITTLLNERKEWLINCLVDCVKKLTIELETKNK